LLEFPFDGLHRIFGGQQAHARLLAVDFDGFDFAASADELVDAGGHGEDCTTGDEISAKCPGPKFAS
jgi:hypothetical protein